MDIKKEDLPVTLQAFELHDNTEIFVAEQVVSNQPDIDRFTSLYAGKIIKARKDTIKERNNSTSGVTKKRNPAVGIVMIVIILVLTALIIYGFSTGWIQQKFNLNI